MLGRHDRWSISRFQVKLAATLAAYKSRAAQTRASPQGQTHLFSGSSPQFDGKPSPSPSPQRPVRGFVPEQASQPLQPSQPCLEFTSVATQALLFDLYLTELIFWDD